MATDARPATRVTDPICGMEINPTEAAATCTFIGVTYYFCSAECHHLFERAPERHIVHLAHEPANEHYGHCCPAQRRLRSQRRATENG